jgi:hypothetical protein
MPEERPVTCSLAENDLFFRQEHGEGLPRPTQFAVWRWLTRTNTDTTPPFASNIPSELSIPNKRYNTSTRRSVGQGFGRREPLHRGSSACSTTTTRREDLGSASSKSERNAAAAATLTP